MKKKKILCIIGPTAVGKTDLSMDLALELDTEIISCDSRQVYREMRIGTAVPEAQYLQKVTHHFIGSVSVEDYYSVYRYEVDALAKAEELFRKRDFIVLTGGSGLYLDAFLFGMDDIPDPDPEIRKDLEERLVVEGMESLRFELKRLDPEYYGTVDLKNPKRVMRGLEVCLSTGKTFSQFRIRSTEARSFEYQIFCLDRERAELHQRINTRVDSMMKNGLLEEVKNLYPHRHLNALKTVGYRELFDAIDGKHSFETAVELIKRNTRRYARRQLTWNKKYKDSIWLDAKYQDVILKEILDLI